MLAMAKNEQLGPFRGINNRLPDDQMVYRERGVRVFEFLRNAINTDVTNGGGLKRRTGVTRSVIGTDCHSLWCHNDQAYYVDNGSLYAFPRTLLDVGPVASRVSYCKAGTDIVWSDGRTLKKIVDGASIPLVQPEPNPMPAVAATADGALTEGLYLISFVAIGPSGQSLPSWSQQLSVPANGRIEVTGLTGPTDIYLSGPNDNQLFLAGRFTTSASLAFQATGPMLTTRNLRPMPPGRIVRYIRGRLLVAAGSVLYYSEPFAPGLYNPARGYIPFPADIDLVAPVLTGVFISADKTYFLAGDDIDSAKPEAILPYKAVFGTDTYNEVDESAWWYSQRGMVRGEPNGKVTNVQEADIAAPPAQSGASLYRDYDGLRHVVSSLFGAEVTRAAASSYIDAEVIRKEKMQ